MDVIVTDSFLAANAAFDRANEALLDAIEAAQYVLREIRAYPNATCFDEPPIAAGTSRRFPAAQWPSPAQLNALIAARCERLAAAQDAWTALTDSEQAEHKRPA